MKTVIMFAFLLQAGKAVFLGIPCSQLSELLKAVPPLLSPPDGIESLLQLTSLPLPTSFLLDFDGHVSGSAFSS